MRIIGFDREDEAEQWARERLGLDVAPSFCRAFSAVDENDQFVCVVVMTNFSARNIDLNIVMDRKKMRPKGTVEMYNRIFSFVFNTAKAARATGLIRGKNIESKTAAEKFGFKLEGIMRKSFTDDDLHIYGLLAEDYYGHAWFRS